MKHGLSSTLVTLISLLLSSQVFAGGYLVDFSGSNSDKLVVPRWRDAKSPIKWYINDRKTKEYGISDDDITKQLSNAMAVWNDVPTSNVTNLLAGSTSINETKLDGVNVITFSDGSYPFSTGVLAVCANYYFSGVVDNDSNDLNSDGVPDLVNGYYPPGSIIDSDIIFNPQYAHQISDVTSILEHEIGHCMGLSHSSIKNSVMWPFDNGLRNITSDEKAYISQLYPNSDLYSKFYGAIHGKVTSGIDGHAILGAHIYIVDPESGSKTIGGYSMPGGEFSIPAPIGRYYIGIEPLDGSPIGMDPERINRVVAGTTDTDFPEELYDANESHLEINALKSGLPIDVIAGANVNNINFVTNTTRQSGSTIELYPGLNLFSYPVALPADLSAFELLQAIGDSDEVLSVDNYNQTSAKYERALYLDGVPAGDNFTIKPGFGYLVRMKKSKSIGFSGLADCQNINLKQGLNFIGVNCPPVGYSASDLLEALGGNEVIKNIQRFNRETGTYEVVYSSGVAVQSHDFPINVGEAYVVNSLADISDIPVTKQTQLFPPEITSLSPGAAPAKSIITINGSGFASKASQNVVVFSGNPNSVGAQVLSVNGNSISVKVPSSATSGPVYVIRNGKESNKLNFEIKVNQLDESFAKRNDITDGNSVSAGLDSLAEIDRYTFVATAGTVVTITAKAKANNIPRLLLALESPLPDPQEPKLNKILIKNDGNGKGIEPAITDFTVPVTGRYTVIVTGMPDVDVSDDKNKGDYSLDIKLTPKSAPAAINVIGGNFQNAVAGTELAKPIELLLTGVNGRALAGIPVQLTATQKGAGGMTGSPFIAGSSQLISNANGSLSVSAAVPSAPGMYDITITAPGMEPVTISVAVLNTAIATVEVSGNHQNCGNGCPVDQLIPEPFSLKFRAADGSPVAGMSAWQVISGDGSINGGKSLITQGDASVNFKVGKTIYDLEKDQPVPQWVLATIPGQTRPVIFDVTARSGDVTKILPVRSDNKIYSTVHLWSLSGIVLRAVDKFDNPVSGASISVSGDISPTLVKPGYYEEEVFNNYLTNAKGIWAGMIRGVVPTLNHLGAVMRPSHLVHTSSGSAKFDFEQSVGFGPALAITSDYALNKPVGSEDRIEFELVRYQPIDNYVEIKAGKDSFDEDKYLWDDEAYYIANPSRAVFAQMPVPGATVHFSLVRDDKYDFTDSKFAPATIDGRDETTKITPASGDSTVSLLMRWGEVPGKYKIIAKTDPVNVSFVRSLSIDMSSAQWGAISNTLTGGINHAPEEWYHNSPMLPPSAQLSIHDSAYVASATNGQRSAELRIFPENGYVFADDPTIELFADLPLLYDEIGEGEVDVTWHVSGPEGKLESPVTMSTFGSFGNLLTMKPKAGNQYQVEAEVTRSTNPFYKPGYKRIFGPFTVLPGPTAQIKLSSQQSSLVADNHDTIEVQAELKDAFGNLVQDGTSVEWDYSDDLVMDEGHSALLTKDGIAKAVFRAGSYVGDVTITARAGGVDGQMQTIKVSDQIDLKTKLVNVTISPSVVELDADMHQQAVFTVNAPQATDGAEVDWITTTGQIVSKTPIQGGVATLTLQASSVASDGLVIAKIAGATAQAAVKQRSRHVSGRLEYAAIVGNRLADGYVNIEQRIGADESFRYVTQTKLLLSGQASEQMELSLGSPLEPNAEPLANFPLQRRLDGKILALDGNHYADVYGGVAFPNDYLQLNGESYLQIPQSADLSLANDLAVSLNFAIDADAELASGEPDTPSSESETGKQILFRQGKANAFSYQLALIHTAQDTYQLEASFTGADGVQTLTHPYTLQSGKHYSAGIRVNKGQLALQLAGELSGSGDRIVYGELSGDLRNIASDIVVGRGFRGQLGQLKFTSEAADRLLSTFEDGSQRKKVTAGSDGQAAIAIRASGRLASIGSMVGINVAKGNGALAYHPQPLRLSAGQMTASLLGITPAHAGWFWDDDDDEEQRVRLAVVQDKVFGWFSDITNKVTTTVKNNAEALKTTGMFIADVLSVGDFIVIAQELWKLVDCYEKDDNGNLILDENGNPKTQKINKLDLGFAVAGASLTIFEVVSAGSAAPMVEPIQMGMTLLKTSIKAAGNVPETMRTVNSMIDAFGPMLKNILASDRKVMLAKFVNLVKTMALVGRHMTSEFGQTLKQLIKSPKDFITLIAANKVATENVVGLACDIPASMQASSGCDALEALMKRIGHVLDDVPQEKLLEVGDDLNNVLANLEKTIDELSSLNGFGGLGSKLKLDVDTIDGIIHMAKQGKFAKHADGIIRAIIKRGHKDGMTLDQINATINSYFHLINDLNKVPDADKVIEYRFYSQFGILDSFISGTFFQLEVINDFRKNCPTCIIKAVERRSGGVVDVLDKDGTVIGQVKLPVRFSDFDVEIDGVLHTIELKNYAALTSSYRKSIRGGFKKELAIINRECKKNGPCDPKKFIDGLKKRHIVLRGEYDAEQVKSLISELKNEVESALKTSGLDVKDKKATLAQANQLLDAYTTPQKGGTGVNAILSGTITFMEKKGAYGE